jgi:hypothetical protein
VDYRERVAECLAAFADELPAGAAPPGELYEAWVALSFAVTRAMLRDASGLDAIRLALESAGREQAWTHLLDLGRRLHLGGPELGALRLRPLEDHPRGACVAAARGSRPSWSSSGLRSCAASACSASSA